MCIRKHSKNILKTRKKRLRRRRQEEEEEEEEDDDDDDDFDPGDAADDDDDEGDLECCKDIVIDSGSGPAPAPTPAGGLPFQLGVMLSQHALQGLTWGQ